MYESTLFLGLCALAVKDLGCHTAQQHSSHHGEQGLRQHIAAVVGQAVGPGGQAISQVGEVEADGVGLYGEQLQWSQTLRRYETL